MSTSILFLPINLAKLSRTRLWFIVKEIVGLKYTSFLTVLVYVGCTCGLGGIQTDSQLTTTLR